MTVRFEPWPPRFHVPPCPYQQLPARRLRPPHRRGDFVEPEGEHLAKHEHRPLQRALLASVFPLMARIDVMFGPQEINGQPGAIFRDRDGKVLHILALEVLDGQIHTIRSVINPHKLGHLGPVADAWAVDHEVKQARRQMK